MVQLQAGEFDLIVIGGGPSGYVAAIHAAELGAKVALIEKANLGGTCLNAGCIPTKVLVRSAEVLETTRRAAEFGVVINGPISFSWEKVQARRAEVVRTLVEGLTRLVRGHGIEIINGEGRLLPAGSGADQRPVVEVRSSAAAAGEAAGESGEARRRLVASNVILALGSVPARIPVPGLDAAGVIGSDEALALDRPPARLAIVGGGVIGVEFASIYRSFGSEVTIIEMMPTLLPVADEEISKRLALSFKRRGIRVETGASLTEVTGSAGNFTLRFERNGKAEEVQAETILVAVGRRPNLAGLEEAGVEIESGRVRVNDRQQTSRPHVYAVGDVTGGTMLAHAAFMQGMVAAENALGGKAQFHHPVPAAVFSAPEVAWVGATEEELKKNGTPYQLVKLPFAAVGKAQVLGETEGMIKLIGEAGDPGAARLLGAHLIGPNATELVHEYTLALQNGLTIKQVAETIHAHPTLSEAVVESAHLFLGMPVHVAPARSTGGAASPAGTRGTSW
ncbi:MAG: dihydrolipoyl dehydrogenase [Limnochordales bacterium]|nr:dihydrolipoyl dehydrogenase [Limnochordales bacterium]